MIRPGIFVAAIALLAGFATAAASDERRALRTVEGAVISLDALPAEGELPVVAVRLAPTGHEGEPFEILLAPQEILDTIGFEVAVGDSIRAKVFVAAEGPFKTHKVLNISRGTMVRLRALHETPLWSGRGQWEGGACRGDGPRHGGERGGRGGGHGKGQGPGR